MRVREMDEVRRPVNSIVIDCDGFAVALTHLGEGNEARLQRRAAITGSPRERRP